LTPQFLSGVKICHFTADIESISLFVDDAEITEDGQVDLDLPKPMKFRCVVTGSNPAPVVRLHRGNEESDITQDLEESTFSYSVERTVQDEKKAMLKLQVTAVLEGNLLVDSHSSRKQLLTSSVLPMSWTGCLTKAEA
jgi:hypothetical protein